MLPVAIVRAVSAGVRNKGLTGAKSVAHREKARAVAERAAKTLPKKEMARVSNHLQKGNIGAVTQMTNKYEKAIKEATKVTPFTVKAAKLIGGDSYHTAVARGAKIVAEKAAQAEAEKTGDYRKVKAAKLKAKKEYEAKVARFVRPIEGASKAVNSKYLKALATGDAKMVNKVFKNSITDSIRKARFEVANPGRILGVKGFFALDPRLNSKILQATLRGMNPYAVAKKELENLVRLDLHPKSQRKVLRRGEVKKFAGETNKINSLVEFLRNAENKSDDEITRKLDGLMFPGNKMDGTPVWVDKSDVEWTKKDLAQKGKDMYTVAAADIRGNDPFLTLKKIMRGLKFNISNEGDAFIRGLLVSMESAGIPDLAPTIYDAVIKRAKAMTAVERTAAAGGESGQMFFSSSVAVIGAYMKSLLRKWGLNPDDFPADEVNL